MNLLYLYFSTIRHLKFSQIYHRIFRHFSRRIPVPSSSLEKRENFSPRAFFEKKKSILNKNSFLFLNQKEELNLPNDWTSQSHSALWIYNLHYFDGLLSSKTSLDLKLSLLERWISENTNKLSIGWDPYPLSLRIINLIKFAWLNNIEKDSINVSLAIQARYLSKNLEKHLLGNHLLENAKALIFSGVYFSGKEPKKWLQKGIRILKQQLEEQILDDGGHFELSPMYHSISIELIQDILVLCCTEDCPRILKKEEISLKEYLDKMTKWLISMIHKDLEISYFNDSVPGIASKPYDLIKRSERILRKNFIKEENDFIYLKDSGYIRVENKDSLLLFDVAPIGPKYLSGHSHADTLSIEVSLFSKRVIVNSGTSVYEEGKRRSFERSTEAHSTLTINKKSSSQVWASFRTGRRAYPKLITKEINTDSIYIEAEHDGYSRIFRKLKHLRKIIHSENSISIEDNIIASKSTPFEVNFFFHPGVSCKINEDRMGGELSLSESTISWSVKEGSCFLSKSEYAVGFNLLESNDCLTVVSPLGKKTIFELSW